MTEQFHSETQPPEEISSPTETQPSFTTTSEPLYRRWVSIRSALMIFLSVLAAIVTLFLLQDSRNGNVSPDFLRSRDVAPTPIADSAFTGSDLPASSPTAILPPTYTPTIALTGTSTPLPAATHSPTPEPIAIITTSLTLFQEIEQQYQSAQATKDGMQLKSLLNLLLELEQTEPAVASEIETLKRKTKYALDALVGTTYLDSNNTTRVILQSKSDVNLQQPIDMSVGGDAIYVVGNGTLYRTDVRDVMDAGDEAVISMTSVLTPTTRIDGYLIKEIVAVEASNIERGVYVLDKSNDIYYSEQAGSAWSAQRSQASGLSRPDPHFLSVSSFADRLYLLDPSRNQIWRHPPGEMGVGYLPSQLPWLIGPGEPDVTRSVDLSIDGFVYVLDRLGNVVKYLSAEVARFSLDVAQGKTQIAELEAQPLSPIALFAGTEGSPLFIADPGKRRVVALDRDDGSFLWQLTAPDNPDLSRLHAVLENDGFLLMLAGASIYRYDLKQIDSREFNEGLLPFWVDDPLQDSTDEQLKVLWPNDPGILNLLDSYRLIMPLSGAHLPDRYVMYPGARRAYRYGVHRGIDFYQNDIGIELSEDTPVLAAAKGVVVRADTDFQEMSVDEVNSRLNEAFAQHITSEETLDKLGGRQVWIDHGGGLLTKYEHLSGVTEGLEVGQLVEQGQTIGYVGASGIPDKIMGNSVALHLHFELRFGPGHQYYLGQWLTIEETRRLFEQLFDVPVGSQPDN